ncbi:terminase large subunit domain-containing protein [Haloferax namakaokahaiae]|uniref:Terminase large subunit domain-containing protein n=1 Tax=Haloferax namakaokahaiae TaxID=1748331 RepID=A0ABD5ZCI3_9EURY
MSQTSEPIQIGGQYWSAQLETFDALESGDYDLVVFRAGYGGGKTLLGSDFVLGGAMQIPNGHSLVLAPDKTKGGPATYKGFFERLPGDNTVPNDAEGDPENSPIVAGYHGTKHRLTLINGHIIQLGGADIWSRFAGTEFNIIWCDEVAHYGTTDLYDLHEMLVTRQRTEQGPNVTLWTSTGNGFNQFYDITERQIEPDGQGGEQPLPWADRMKVVVGDTRDNPFHNELEKMRAQFEGTEREKQALEGGFSSANGLVYPSFSRETHICSRGELELRDARLYGYDYGFKDPRVLLEIGETTAGQYAVLDEYYVSKQPVEKLAGAWNGRTLVREGWIQEQGKTPGRVFCDHDPEHIEKFARAGFESEAAQKDLAEGINEVQSVLETDDGRPGLVIVDDCINLIQEFQSYKEEDVGTARAQDHALDALRYAIMGDRYVDTKTTRRRRGSAPTKGSIR